MNTSSNISEYVSKYKPQDKEAFVNVVEYDPNDFKQNHTQNVEYTENYPEDQAALSL